MHHQLAIDLLVTVLVFAGMFPLWGCWRPRADRQAIGRQEECGHL